MRLKVSFAGVTWVWDLETEVLASSDGRRHQVHGVLDVIDSHASQLLVAGDLRDGPEGLRRAFVGDAVMAVSGGVIFGVIEGRLGLTTMRVEGHGDATISSGEVFLALRRDGWRGYAPLQLPG